MPTKMLAALARPSAPPMRKPRSSTTPIAFTIQGRMRQWVSSAVSALVTITMGRAWKAKTKAAPGRDSAKGSAPPPR